MLEQNAGILFQARDDFAPGPLLVGTKVVTKVRKSCAARRPTELGIFHATGHDPTIEAGDPRPPANLHGSREIGSSTPLQFLQRL